MSDALVASILNAVKKGVKKNELVEPVSQVIGTNKGVQVANKVPQDVLVQAILKAIKNGTAKPENVKPSLEKIVNKPIVQSVPPDVLASAILKAIQAGVVNIKGTKLPEKEIIEASEGKNNAANKIAKLIIKAAGMSSTETEEGIGKSWSPLSWRKPIQGPKTGYFIPSNTFEGGKNGYEFTKGPLGQGYYRTFIEGNYTGEIPFYFYNKNKKGYTRTRLQKVKAAFGASQKPAGTQTGGGFWSSLFRRNKPVPSASSGNQKLANQPPAGTHTANQKPAQPAGTNNFNKNLRSALNESSRYERLLRLYALFQKKEYVKYRPQIIEQMRLVIRKMYGSNVSSSNARRNIENAKRTVGGKVSKQINENLNVAMKRLGISKNGSRYGNYGRGGGNYGYGRVVNRGAVQPTISVSGAPVTVNVKPTSQTGPVNVRPTFNVTPPTANGNRYVQKTPNQLVQNAGGVEKVEKGIEALRAANGNVNVARQTSRLPINTFTNIYAMGGVVAAKKAVASIRRHRRHVTKKKRVVHKPRRRFIKLTSYQFKRLTDHIKKNNLRKVLIKEITH